MTDRHKYRPFTFRPSADDRGWLLAYAERTGIPVRRIIADALTLYRQFHARKGREAARRIIEMLAADQQPEGLSFEEKWGAARDATQLLLGDALTATGVDDLLADPATNPLGARREDIKSSMWDQLCRGCMSGSTAPCTCSSDCGRPECARSERT